MINTNKKIQFILTIACLAVLWIVLYLKQHSWPHVFAALNSLCLLGTGIVLLRFFDQLYFMLFNHTTLAPRFMYYFGYTKNQSFSEFWILKIILQGITIIGCVYLIAQQFVITQPLMNMLNKSFFHGVQCAQFI